MILEMLLLHLGANIATTAFLSLKQGSKDESISMSIMVPKD